MKTDIAGCSTCGNGEERYEEFKYGKTKLIQYDYGSVHGDLFSCCKKTIIACRIARDEWLMKKFQATIKE